MRRAGRGLCAASLLVLGTGGWAGPGTPGAEYFRGLYERVGRDGFDLPVNDRVRIEPLGESLSLESCTADPVAMTFAPWSLGENFLSARAGSETFVCQFHNNGDNRPIFTCQSDRGAKVTLWPVEGDFRGGPLLCGG